MTADEMLTAERARELLNYDPETGVLTWKGGRRGVRVGSIAGTPNTRGYLTVGVDRRRYFAHRLAWLIATGEWPAEHLDHINGIPVDNRLANLREATNAQNQYNQKMANTNTSGFKGVTWHRQRCKWVAYARHSKQQIHLGCFDTPEQASVAYEFFCEQARGEFHRIVGGAEQLGGRG